MTKDRAALLQRCHSRTTLHGRSDTTGQKCHDTHKDDGSEGDTSGETMASFPPTRSVVGMAMVEDRRSAPAAVQAVPLIKTRPIALALSSIDVGEKLGEGRFGMVHACTVPAALCGASSDQQFVIKTLKTNLTDDLDRWIRGAADMATEASILKSLRHPNVIGIHAVSAEVMQFTSASATVMDQRCPYFVVVDRMVETLETRLCRWRQNDCESPTLPRSAATGWNALGQLALYRTLCPTLSSECVERLRIAESIASVMVFLHAKNIVFCNLRPDKIGFDEHGALKLFDFGLATQQRPNCVTIVNGKWAMTKGSGSLPYVAPEVARSFPYNHAVDVYSFGIVLWELCTLQKPFHGYGPKQHMNRVVLGGERPCLDNERIQSAGLQALLRHCWSPFPGVRPSFKDIHPLLRDLVNGNGPMSRVGSLRYKLTMLHR